MMKFTLPVRVYYEDTDAGGVVYHSRYLNYCERARTEVLRTLGLEQSYLIENNDILFAVRSIQVDYLKPAQFDDEVIVETHIKQLKKASITFIQVIHQSGSDEVLCRLVVRIACLMASELRPRAIPEAILDQLEALRAG